MRVTDWPWYGSPTRWSSSHTVKSSRRAPVPHRRRRVGYTSECPPNHSPHASWTRQATDSSLTAPSGPIVQSQTRVRRRGKESGGWPPTEHVPGAGDQSPRTCFLGLWEAPSPIRVVSDPLRQAPGAWLGRYDEFATG